MKLPPGPLVNTLAILMVAIDVILRVTGLHARAVVAAGFIPGRFALDGGFVAPPGTFLPALVTPLTSAFLHADPLHVIFNVLMLLFIGRQLEAPMGKAAVTILFLAGSLVGCAAQWVAAPATTSVFIGASGAVSALFGCYALIFSGHQARAIGPFSPALVRAATLGAAWIILQLMLGFASGGLIGVWAHIGGFLVGMLLARPLLRRRFNA